jgi:hypothetical protein
MGGQVSRDEFEWVYTQHPHVHRRKMILGEFSLVLYAVVVYASTRKGREGGGLLMLIIVNLMSAKV